MLETVVSHLKISFIIQVATIVLFFNLQYTIVKNFFGLSDSNSSGFWKQQLQLQYKVYFYTKILSPQHFFFVGHLLIDMCLHCISEREGLIVCFEGHFYKF